MEIKKNDLIICAYERDNPEDKVFDIYARVCDVDMENDSITLDRYQKFGALRCKEVVFHEATIEKYYRPMTEEEKQMFAETMYSRKVDLEQFKIHLGGDSVFSGWEDISGNVLETLATLKDYTCRKDKDFSAMLDKIECKREIKRMTADKIVNNIEGITLLSVNDYKEYEKNIPHIYGAWWLRSSYNGDNYWAALVKSDGDVLSHSVYCKEAVRPALYISNLDSSGLEIGDKFDFGEHSFTVISDTYALCDESIGNCAFRGDYKAVDANDYEASDIKAFIEDWYEKALEQIQDREQEDNEHDDPEVDR